MISAGGEAPHGRRRQARERALSLLYEAEAKDRSLREVLAELPAPPEPFAEELVRGVEANLAEIDSLIAACSIDWSVGRMPVVDRNLLRLATYELCHRPDIPMAAAISEAVELAGEYSTEESSRFVNGVLSAIAAQVRREQAPAGPGEQALAGPGEQAPTGPGEQAPAGPGERED